MFCMFNIATTETFKFTVSCFTTLTYNEDRVEKGERGIGKKFKRENGNSNFPRETADLEPLLRLTL